MSTQEVVDIPALKLAELLNAKVSDLLKPAVVNLGDCEVYLHPERLLDFCHFIRNDSELSFEMLISISAVDYLDHDFFDPLRAAAGRYEVVYQFLSLTKNQRLRVKVTLPENQPVVASICSIWKGANFMEREVYDMFGIDFSGHPDLRRILMYPEFKGHPLRKDYPVLGKQPRVNLLHPEVHNTAQDMRRAALVKINKRAKQSANSNEVS